MAEPLARVWDESERAKNAFATLMPGRNPFHVGNKPCSMDINVFHDRTGYMPEPILRVSARQQGNTLTVRIELCNSYLSARGKRAPVTKRSGGRVERDLAPNDVLAIDMCGPFTPSPGGNAGKCVRGDCDALWTSRGFVDFCDTIGIAREHSPLEHSSTTGWSRARFSGATRSA